MIIFDQVRRLSTPTAVDLLLSSSSSVESSFNHYYPFPAGLELRMRMPLSERDAAVISRVPTSLPLWPFKRSIYIVLKGFTFQVLKLCCPSLNAGFTTTQIDRATKTYPSANWQLLPLSRRELRPSTWTTYLERMVKIDIHILSPLFTFRLPFQSRIPHHAMINQFKFLEKFISNRKPISIQSM